MNIKQRINSPNFDKYPIDVSFLIIHYTAGNWERVKSIFEDPSKKVSAHFVIDTNGEIDEVVPCLDGITYRAWHSGISKFVLEDVEISDFNSFSIGIELVNLNGNIIPYTNAQYESLIWLTNELMKKYRKINAPTKILGHEQIAGFRGKADPGLLFEWPRYIQTIFPNFEDIDRTNICPKDLQASLLKFLDITPKKPEDEILLWHSLSHITETAIRLINEKKLQ